MYCSTQRGILVVRNVLRLQRRQMKAIPEEGWNMTIYTGMQMYCSTHKRHISRQECVKIPMDYCLE